MFALLLSTGQSSFLSSSFPIVYSSIVIPISRGNDAGIDNKGKLNQWRKVACRKRRRLDPRYDLSVSIMIILTKDTTEEERGNVFATIKKTSVDVIYVVSELCSERYVVSERVS